jgi:hypothetical protein
MNTCCQGLVASLSQDEWNDLVAPAVAKTRKATPEKVLETCEALIANWKSSAAVVRQTNNNNDSYTSSNPNGLALADLIASLVK